MDKFRKYVDKKFLSYPKSRALDELKEELIATLLERYQEFLASGKSQDEAYQMSIESLGDCKETVNVIESGIEKNTKLLRVKMAALGSAAYWLVVVTLYLVASMATGEWAYTWTVFPVAAAVFLCSIVFIVFPKGRSLGKNLKIRVFALLFFFIATLGVYFLVSFLTRKWAITWTIILCGFSLGLIFDSALIRKTHKTLFLSYIYIIVILLTSAAHHLITEFDLVDASLSWLVYLFSAIGLVVFNLIRVMGKYKIETSFKSSEK